MAFCRDLRHGCTYHASGNNPQGPYRLQPLRLRHWVDCFYLSIAVSVVKAFGERAVRNGKVSFSKPLREFTASSPQHRRIHVPHCSLLGSRQLGQPAEDIRGATLYGSNDEKLGKIDDVIFDHSNGDIRYVVVDTGGWLSTKKFLVPPNRLRPSAEHKDDFAADLNRERIEDFPAYQDSDLDNEKTWADYEGRYRAKWETGPVMHRAGTDRNITPTTQQQQGNQSSIRAEHGLPRQSPLENRAREESRTEGSTRIVPAGTDSVVISNSASGIGGRWDTFQARLRERRKEAVAGCKTCTIGPESVKGSESTETLKKAI